MNEDSTDLAALREERLRLEREAFELEKRRFEEMKARESAVPRIEGSRRAAFVPAALCAAIAFLVGVLAGAGYTEYRTQRAKSARLREALSQLQGVDIDELQARLSSATNAPGAKHPAGPVGAHRNVSVIVVE